MKSPTGKTAPAYSIAGLLDRGCVASIDESGAEMTPTRDRLDPSYFGPFHLAKSFADLLTGHRLLFAEAFGEVLHSTSSLVMLATSRTPAQWITGLPRTDATPSTEARASRSERKKKAN